VQHLRQLSTNILAVKLIDRTLKKCTPGFNVSPARDLSYSPNIVVIIGKSCPASSCGRNTNHARQKCQRCSGYPFPGMLRVFFYFGFLLDMHFASLFLGLPFRIILKLVALVAKLPCGYVEWASPFSTKSLSYFIETSLFCLMSPPLSSFHWIVACTWLIRLAYFTHYGI
jgi:hypothetical protein